MGLGRTSVQGQEARLILLDTNALLWLHRGHRRAAALDRVGRLYVSPASLLEIQVLVEVGRLRLQGGSVVPDLADERWVLDDPPAAAWFQRAIEIAWTRDPFDRLLAAHAVLRKWRLATGDEELAEHLGPDRTLQL